MLELVSILFRPISLQKYCQVYKNLCLPTTIYLLPTLSLNAFALAISGYSLLLLPFSFTSYPTLLFLSSDRLCVVPAQAVVKDDGLLALIQILAERSLQSRILTLVLQHL